MAKFRYVFVGILGLFLLASPSLARAENQVPDGPGLRGHAPGRIQEIYKQLDLTDEQKKQLEANKQQHRTVMESVRRELKSDKEALRAELMKPQLDMSRINSIHHQIKDLQNQMEDNKLNSILAVRSILTPEQFSKFGELMHRHKQEHAE